MLYWEIAVAKKIWKYKKNLDSFKGSIRKSDKKFGSNMRSMKFEYSQK